MKEKESAEPGGLLQGLLTLPQLGRELKLQRWQFYRLLRNGDLPWLRIGQTRYVRQTEIEAWLRNMENRGISRRPPMRPSDHRRSLNNPCIVE